LLCGRKLAWELRSLPTVSNQFAQDELGEAITRRIAIGTFAMSAAIKHNTAQCAALIAPTLTPCHR